MDAVSQTTSSNVFFFHENDRIPIQISLKFVPRSPNDNKPMLVQVLAWRRTGDKPLSEPMIVSLRYKYNTFTEHFYLQITHGKVSV